MPKRGGRKAARNNTEKREAILHASEKLFAEYGFGRTTTRMIAREAGVAEGTIYLYFASKKDILFAFLQPRVLDSLHDVFDDTAGRSERDVLTEFMRSRFRLWTESGSTIRVLITEAFFDRALACEFVENILLPSMGLVQGYIQSRIEDGTFRDVNPITALRFLGGQFIACVVLFGGLGLDPGPDFSYDAYAAEIVDMFLKGVSA